MANINKEVKYRTKKKKKKRKQHGVDGKKPSEKFY